MGGLLVLDGDDLRKRPLLERKSAHVGLLIRSQGGGVYRLVAAPLPPRRGPWPLGRVGRRCGVPDPKSGSGRFISWRRQLAYQ